MDLERTDNFYPVLTLTEDVEKIVLMKAALIAITDEHERSFLAVQNRLKAGKKQIELCTQESNSLELRINDVETKITESLLSNQVAEAEALSTVRENRTLKRKIIALKHDMEQQEKLLQRANETLSAVNSCIKNKKLKELST